MNKELHIAQLRGCDCYGQVAETPSASGNMMQTREQYFDLAKLVYYRYQISWVMKSPIGILQSMDRTASFGNSSSRLERDG